MRIAIKTLGCKSNRYESDKVFDEKTKLYVIDLYMSQKSNNPILPWHCDQSYNESYTTSMGKAATKQMDFLKHSHPNEGYLKWVKNCDLFKLNLWEGDIYFLKWLYDSKIFKAVFYYLKNKYTEHEVCFTDQRDLLNISN